MYLLGGESQPVDTEDVAIRASELAPGRFSWRKYPDQINLELIRVYLSDAKKPDKGAYLLGSGKEGWMLSEAGVRFALRNAQTLSDSDLSRVAMTPKQRQWLQTERTRLLASTAYRKHLADDAASITRKEAEDFFRVDDYVAGQARERRIVRLLNAFRDDPELGALLALMAERVRGT